MQINYDLNPRFRDAIRIAPSLAVTLSLAQASFAQTLDKEDVWLKTGLKTLEISGEEFSTPNSIPIVFSSNSEHQPGSLFEHKKILYKEFDWKYEMRIRGSLARELYKKNVVLIQLNRDLEIPEWVSNGEGLIFIQSKPGSIRTESFKISPISFDRSWNFSTQYDPSLGTHEANLHTMREIRESVAQVLNITDYSGESPADGVNVDDLYRQHLIKIVTNATKPFNAGTWLENEFRQKYPSVSEELLEIHKHYNSKLNDFDKLATLKVPNHLESTQEKFKEELILARRIDQEFHFTTNALIAFIDIKSVNEDNPTLEEILEMDPVSFIRKEIDDYLETFEILAASLREGVEIYEKRQAKLKEAWSLTNAAQDAPFVDTGLFEALTNASRSLQKNLPAGSSEFNKSWSDFNQLREQYSKAEKQYTATQNQLAAQETARIEQEQESKDLWQKVWIGLGFAGAAIVGFLGLLLGGAPTRTSGYSSYSPPSKPTYDDEPYYGGEAQTRNPNAYHGD